MQPGKMILTRMDRVIFGEAAASAIAGEAQRLDAHRVFLLVSATLHRETQEIEAIISALGQRYAGIHDDMPSHSPRSAVLACANAARDVGADLLVSVGGGSVTDGAKAVTICLEHGLREVDELEPFRTVVSNAIRTVPEFRGPSVRQIAVPTTLSGGEFNARAGITDTRLGLKQSYVHPDIIPLAVILDASITVHTPEWLWLSTGIRAVDHAVETLCSVDANAYTDGTAQQALRLLATGLPAVKADANDHDARLQCLMGAWLSMVGIVTGSRLGASHAIGHILGGSANVPHGYTSCVMLPNVLAFNAAVNAERQAIIAQAMGRAGVPAHVVLDEFIAGLGMPRTLTELGVARAALPVLAENCMLDDWTFSNPRPISSPQQVMEILESAM